MSNERDDRGKFVTQVTLEDILGILRRTSEPMTATELSTELGISNRAILNKLNTLHERGDVRRKKVGGRSVVWWLPDEPTEKQEINPDDPFWDAEPVAAGGPTDVSSNVDEYLYGEPESDE
ncbi:helix-turn-helix domain-containing protein [Natronococcus sp. JC468]|uniref:helix-turn-helix domain-containing protein n=1 Tax=Natronococcus TaxID=29287 RepID=UPI00143AFD41|nr:helix-turn-helix domain-containing protein [Natronococcus sp. JC468]NKE38085.1 helix-turn-helix domain-containing protein [Natronococcus sp. JC468]